LADFAREKIENLVDRQMRQPQAKEKSDSSARAHAASLWAHASKYNPQNTQFRCGYVHRKIAQTLKG
jgi:hypothetical protein